MCPIRIRVARTPRQHESVWFLSLLGQRRSILSAVTLACLFSIPVRTQSVEKGSAVGQSAKKPNAGQQESVYPQLKDITASTGIQFEHRSSPEQRFIVESMSGGVALIGYDRDGWPDIYFTNAQRVEMAQRREKARSALFHNNRDGTLSDVTDAAGVGFPCWAMGDYNNDGWPDLLVTCFGGVVLYRNNGDGHFYRRDTRDRPGKRSHVGHRRGVWRL